jgi:hypothetical protein
MSNDKMMIVYNGGAYLALSRKILDDDTIWYECLPLNGSTTVWYQDTDLLFDKTDEIMQTFDKNLHFLQALDQSLRFLKSIAPQD